MICEFCNNEFEKKPTRGYPKRFCSPLCQNKAWRKANPEASKAIDKRKYAKSKFKIIARVMAYTKLHPESAKARCKKYSLTENGKIHNRAKAKRHRARLLGATGSHSAWDFLQLVKDLDFYCVACGNQFEFNRLTEDHIVPLSKGGSNDIGNIQPMCAPCNSRKKDKTVNYLTDFKIAKGA